MGRRRKRHDLTLDIRKETIYSVVGVVLIAVGVLVVVSFTGQGAILAMINQILIKQFGFATLLFPFLCIAGGLVMFQTQWAWSKPHVLLGGVLLTTGIMGLFRTGEIGTQTAVNIARLLTPVGGGVLFLVLIIIGVFIMSQLSVAEVVEFINGLLPKPKYVEEDAFAPSPADEISQSRFPTLGMSNLLKKPAWLANIPGSKADGEEAEASEEEPEQEPVKDSKAAKKASKRAVPEDPKDLLKPLSYEAEGDGGKPTDENAVPIWEYPPLTILSDKAGGEADRGDVRSNAQIITSTLQSFGIRAEVVEVNYGPAVTQYALQIALGTKLSRLTSLATDLALALAAPTGQIRIEAPIAGRSLVGIEVPNKSAQFVTLRTMLTHDLMKKNASKLAVALGLNVAGLPVVADIGKMPHVLIAGATGSGKSVAVNTFICSILFRASPEEVKFIMVDPKRVELTAYSDIPHLLTPVIVEPPKVVSALKWACVEMDNRYKKLAEVGVKNIDSYNELAGFQAMHKIVIFIDELADIMLFAPAEVEESITRIAQMARAVGIHLVLATQRPSVDVITGLIKANIPTRIAFNVSSMTDSRVIIDGPGAEKLLGRGDMLYVPPDQAKPSRIQGTFVSEPEIKRLVEHVRNQGRKPKYEEEITTKYQTVAGGGGMSGGGGAGSDSLDPLFDAAIKLFAGSDKASSSMIQRRLSVGYARAARILDQLEQEGFVGPAEGSKPRDVNVRKVKEHLMGGAAAAA
jgi:DNA segregation ATPase FtsK/SpoIIIE, S-DNA-T family